MEMVWQQRPGIHIQIALLRQTRQAGDKIVAIFIAYKNISALDPPAHYMM